MFECTFSPANAFCMKTLKIILSLVIAHMLSQSPYTQPPWTSSNCKQLYAMKEDEEESIKSFFAKEYEKQATTLCNTAAKAEWNHEIDLEDTVKAAEAINASLQVSKFDRNIYNAFVSNINLNRIRNHDFARRLEKISNIGYAALKKKLLTELNKILSEMETIYGTAKICPYAKPMCNESAEGLAYFPDIENIMANSYDYDELMYTWISWHDATGGKMKRSYEYYVVLGNEAAQQNNFSNRGEVWRSAYEMDNFELEVDRLWAEVEPLYVELHTYVRSVLRKVYRKEMAMGEEDGEEDDGLIPVHLLGNMWGQNWINLRSWAMPYPDEAQIDLGNILKANNVSVMQMFRMANTYLTSMGLEDVHDAFTGSAIVEKPKDSRRSMLCHASAWDFCDGKDFRVKMCAQVGGDDFITIHHELGHVLYYKAYKEQPITYRCGANPSFHEAVGDALALPLFNPEHFKQIQMVDSLYAFTHEQKINMLMEVALVKVAFLPFGYLVDKWRWDIFAERVDPEKWNEHFWTYRALYQRVKPPVVRTTDDFDAGAKYHVAADTEYISYFVAHILEFQMFKSLCELRSLEDDRQTEDELSDCMLLNNRLAGRKLTRAMKLGGSKHWKFVLKELTGESELSTDAILEYFMPLRRFLQKANKKGP